MRRSRVPQDKGGAKSNLAEALAAGTRETGGARRVGHPRGSTRRAKLCLFAVWTVPSRAAGRSPRSAEDPEAARQRPRHNLQQVGSTQRVCGSANFWNTECGRCASKNVYWVFLKDVDKTNVHSARILRKDLATGVAKTLTWTNFLFANLVEKNRGDVSPFAIPLQLWGVKRIFCAKHSLKVNMTLGSCLHGGGVAFQKQRFVECIS